MHDRLRGATKSLLTRRARRAYARRMAQTRADVAVHAVVDAVTTGHLANIVVDDSTMSTWLPRATLEAAGIRPERTQDFERPDGTIISRPIGFAILTVQGRETVEDVVFAEPGDRVRLGARTLSGLNLRIAPDGTLVDGGPIIAASASTDWRRNGDGRRHGERPLTRRDSRPHVASRPRAGVGVGGALPR